MVLVLNRTATAKNPAQAYSAIFSQSSCTYIAVWKLPRCYTDSKTEQVGRVRLCNTWNFSSNGESKEVNDGEELADQISDCLIFFKIVI